MWGFSTFLSLYDSEQNFLSFPIKSSRRLRLWKDVMSLFFILCMWFLSLNDGLYFIWMGKTRKSTWKTTTGLVGITKKLKIIIVKRFTVIRLLTFVQTKNIFQFPLLSGFLSLCDAYWICFAYEMMSPRSPLARYRYIIYLYSVFCSVLVIERKRKCLILLTMTEFTFSCELLL